MVQSPIANQRLVTTSGRCSGMVVFGGKAHRSAPLFVGRRIQSHVLSEIVSDLGESSEMLKFAQKPEGPLIEET